MQSFGAVCTIPFCFDLKDRLLSRKSQSKTEIFHSKIQ
jgi:hypothetical protein